MIIESFPAVMGVVASAAVPAAGLRILLNTKVPTSYKFMKLVCIVLLGFTTLLLPTLAINFAIVVTGYAAQGHQEDPSRSLIWAGIAGVVGFIGVYAALSKSFDWVSKTYRLKTSESSGSSGD